MRKTSFGEVEIILKQAGKPQAEFLRFTSEGRSHKHEEYESFFVLAGEGKVYSGGDVFEVSPGDLVTIPPGAAHWMAPKVDTTASDNSQTPEQPLEGLLWYHTESLKLRS